MVESFDNYLRSIGYDGMFALSVLSAVILVAVVFAVIVFWPLPRGDK